MPGWWGALLRWFGFGRRGASLTPAQRAKRKGIAAPLTLVARLDQATSQERDDQMIRLARESIRRGFPEQAEVAYQRAARLYQAHGQFKKAAAVLRALTRLRPEDPGVWTDLGAIYEEAGLKADGAQAYAAAARRHEALDERDEARELRNRARGLLNLRTDDILPSTTPAPDDRHSESPTPEIPVVSRTPDLSDEEVQSLVLEGLELDDQVLEPDPVPPRPEAAALARVSLVSRRGPGGDPDPEEPLRSAPSHVRPEPETDAERDAVWAQAEPSESSPSLPAVVPTHLLGAEEATDGAEDEPFETVSEDSLPEFVPGDAPTLGVAVASLSSARRLEPSIDSTGPGSLLEPSRETIRAEDLMDREDEGDATLALSASEIAAGLPPDGDADEAGDATIAVPSVPSTSPPGRTVSPSIQNANTIYDPNGSSALKAARARMGLLQGEEQATAVASADHVAELLAKVRNKSKNQD